MIGISFVSRVNERRRFLLAGDFAFLCISIITYYATLIKCYVRMYSNGRLKKL